MAYLLVKSHSGRDIELIVSDTSSEGPLSGTSDEYDLKKINKDRRAFGNHDLHSLNVISNLKKVTIALEGGADAAASSMPIENGDDDKGDEGTSLDFSSLDVGSQNSRQTR